MKWRYKSKGPCTQIPSRRSRACKLPDEDYLFSEDGHPTGGFDENGEPFMYMPRSVSLRMMETTRSLKEKIFQACLLCRPCPAEGAMLELVAHCDREGNILSRDADGLPGPMTPAGIAAFLRIPYTPNQVHIARALRRLEAEGSIVRLDAIIYFVRYPRVASECNSSEGEAPCR